MSMENCGVMVLTWAPDSSTRALWQFCLQRHIVGKQEELAKEMMNLNVKNIFVHTLKGSIKGHTASGNKHRIAS
jgi:hypothetical protein